MSNLQNIHSSGWYIEFPYNSVDNNTVRYWMLLLFEMIA